MAKLPPRLGVRPKTSISGAHRQLSQKSPPAIWGRTAAALFVLPRVVEGHCSVCPASSRAAFLDDLPAPRSVETSLAAPEAHLEPVHLHGVLATSLHVSLPSSRAREVCGLGWGEAHRAVGHANEIMVYGPRDRDELVTVIGIVRESIQFALRVRKRAAAV